jgi:hypothetical protein
MKYVFTTFRFEDADGWLEIREHPKGEFSLHWTSWRGQPTYHVTVTDEEGNIDGRLLNQFCDVVLGMRWEVREDGEEMANTIAAVIEAQAVARETIRKFKSLR